MKTLVVVACHFKDRQSLCRTTVARLTEAISVATSSDQFLVTGDVPYDLGGPTLAELMREWLIQRGISKSRISILQDGVGTFSEARLACKLLEKDAEIVVTSSPWYFYQGKLIWRRRAKENGLRITFHEIRNTAGWRTRLMYSMIAIVVHIAIILRLERVLENRLTASQEERRKGFKMDGCG